MQAGRKAGTSRIGPLHALWSEYRLRRSPFVAPPAAAPRTQEDRHYLALMFEEHAEHARELETLRATVAGLFMALIAGLLAFAVGDASSHSRLWLAGLLICVASVLGALLNHKYFERYRRHGLVRDGYRRALEQGITPELTEIDEQCQAIHRDRYPFTRDHLPLHAFYFVIYVVTFLAGFILSVLAFLGLTH